MPPEDLESYLVERGIKFRIIEFGGSTKTVEDAERMLGVDRSRIVKSLLFVDEKGVPVLAIVTGDSMVDEEKLARVLGVKRVRKARPRAVRNITGYEVGALPPVGHKKPVKTVIDVKVMEKDVVYGGGGSVNKLLEISPRDIKKLTGALVADVSRA